MEELNSAKEKKQSNVITKNNCKKKKNSKQEHLWYPPQALVPLKRKK